ncbi:hypothetical protein GFC01_01985 [Desulfofundulus thermobenzoicus]|uniref:Uncharacterized protein n=1 Tax=Desulfofundulus thermobenzoicus TaxID=29376 RepID=A0A6N7IP15_9FIRM|nr:hypothetical protein [Desulfofundulus thermobenzoicus]MQL51058.1 hypothetical protein [Desulfofundulus thermobenzoicus]
MPFLTTAGFGSGWSETGLLAATDTPGTNPAVKDAANRAHARFFRRTLDLNLFVLTFFPFSFLTDFLMAQQVKTSDRSAGFTIFTSSPEFTNDSGALFAARRTGLP